MHSIPSGPDLDYDPPAISLLEGLNELERELLITYFGEETKELKSLPWEYVAKKVYLPRHN
ncbi:MAG: hypothetical protein M0T74_03755 [Desulfitobacterium hafniense]|nr:hypothetical protein [Desulfitobacterium hafniense]